MLNYTGHNLCVTTRGFFVQYESLGFTSTGGVRLFNTDTPEKGEPSCAEATEALKQLGKGKKRFGLNLKNRGRLITLDGYSLMSL